MFHPTKAGIALLLLQALACDAGEQLDCSRKYSEDGHGQTTEFVAKSLGFDAETQRRLAYFSQAPDQLALLYSAPAVGIWGVVWIAFRQRIVDTLHSLHGGDAAAVRVRRERLASLVSGFDLRNRESQWKAGFLIHALGDSYAHVFEQDGMPHSYSPVWGHIFDNGPGGSQPDVIKENPVRYVNYVNALCTAMAPRAPGPAACDPDFGHRRACAVIQQDGPKTRHAWSFAADGSRDRPDYARDIQFGSVNEFLTRVKRVLDAEPAQPSTVSIDEL